MIDNAVAKDSVTNRMKVEEGNDLQVGAPMKGEVLEIKVALGDSVEKGQGKADTISVIIIVFNISYPLYISYTLQAKFLLLKSF